MLDIFISLEIAFQMWFFYHSRNNVKKNIYLNVFIFFMIISTGIFFLKPLNVNIIVQFNCALKYKYFYFNKSMVERQNVLKKIFKCSGNSKNYNSK